MLKYIIVVLIVIGGIFSMENMNSANAIGFTSITASEAKHIMDMEKNYTIVDVRNIDEYQAGHIPNAQLVPLPQIADIAEKELPNKEQLLLVYCRSGVRSKKAAGILASLGYTKIKEFGGIIDWPYEVVK